MVYFRFLLFAVLAILAVVYFMARKIPGRIAAGRILVERSAPFSVDRGEGNPRIIVAGDSTAVGTGVADPNQSIAGRLARDFPKATVINLGENGLRTGEVADRLAAHGQERADLVLLQTGGNDILHFTPLPMLRNDLQRLLKTARGMSDHVVVMPAGNVGLAPIFPLPMNWLYTHRARAVRGVFQEIAAEEEATYVDLFSERKDDVFLTDPPRYYSPDFLHPSADGYDVWYGTLRKTLVSLGLLPEE